VKEAEVPEEPQVWELLVGWVSERAPVQAFLFQNQGVGSCQTRGCARRLDPRIGMLEQMTADAGVEQQAWEVVEAEVVSGVDFVEH